MVTGKEKKEVHDRLLEDIALLHNLGYDKSEVFHMLLAAVSRYFMDCCCPEPLNKETDPASFKDDGTIDDKHA